MGVYEWGRAVFLRLQSSDLPAANPEEADFDADGLSNIEEVELGLSPLGGDTDGDGMGDGFETAFSLDAGEADENGNGVADGGEDFDGDSFTNMEECMAWIDPFDPLNGFPPASEAPEAPGQPDVRVTPKGAKVKWADHSDNEALFLIERTANGRDWERVGAAPADATAFLDVGVDEGRIYFYRVSSRNNVPE